MGSADRFRWAILASGPTQNQSGERKIKTVNENRRKGIKSLHLLCISILAMLLVAVPTEKLRAAEIVQETATTTGFAYEDRMLKFYKEEFAKAAILNNN